MHRAAKVSGEPKATKKAADVVYLWPLKSGDLTEETSGYPLINGQRKYLDVLYFELATHNWGNFPTKTLVTFGYKAVFKSNGCPFLAKPLVSVKGLRLFGVKVLRPIGNFVELAFKKVKVPVSCVWSAKNPIPEYADYQWFHPFRD